MDKAKVPCPKCERPMTPRHTKGTDFLPRHQDQSGERCPGSGDVVNAKPRCEDCGEDFCHKVTAPVLAEAQPGRPPTSEEVLSWKVDDDGVLDLNQWQRQASTAAKRHQELLAPVEGDSAYVALVKEELGDETVLSVPDEFATPAAEPDPFDTPATAPKKLNVSGQPDARRDHQKRYILVDPELGDFRRTVKERKPKGITRATTFNKAAQNTTALNAWGKRNVVMGASLRPDILRRAHGLNHETGKQELDRIVDELETAAGAKVAADEGTFLHEFCDQVDAGLKTWRDAPAAYQQDIKRYVEALAAAGLEPVPGLIERTTFIREYGGVAGTFDRIFHHRPSDRYIVGDLKTGKTMSYAMDETECQIWTYAHGVNQWGVYDWNTDTWERAWPDMTDRDPDEYSPITVSETVGVIIHMPVQGPEAGEVHLRFANLESGRAYAELNYAVRSYPKSKVQSFDGSRLGPEPAAPPATHRDWHAEFRAVTSREQANALYAELEASGANEEYLAVAVVLGKQALSGVDTSS